MPTLQNILGTGQRPDVQRLTMESILKPMQFYKENKDQLMPEEQQNLRQIISSGRAVRTLASRLPQENAQPIVEQVLDQDDESTIQKILKPFTYEERKISEHILAPILGSLGMIELDKLKEHKDVYFEDLLRAGGMEEGALRTVLGMVGGWAISPSSWVLSIGAGGLRQGAKMLGKVLTPVGMAKRSELFGSSLLEVLEKAGIQGGKKAFKEMFSDPLTLERASSIQEKVWKNVGETWNKLDIDGHIPSSMYEKKWGLYAHIPLTKKYWEVTAVNKPIELILNSVGATKTFQDMAKRLEPITYPVSRLFSRYAFRNQGNIETVTGFFDRQSWTTGLPPVIAEHFYTEKKIVDGVVKRIPIANDEQFRKAFIAYEQLGNSFPRKTLANGKRETLAGWVNRLKDPANFKGVDDAAKAMGLDGGDKLIDIYRRTHLFYDYGRRLAGKEGININEAFEFFIAHIYNMESPREGFQKFADDIIQKISGDTQTFGSLGNWNKERVIPTGAEVMKILEDSGIGVKLNTSLPEVGMLWMSSIYNAANKKRFIREMVEKGGVSEAKVAMKELVDPEMYARELEGDVYQTGERAGQKVKAEKYLSPIHRPETIKPFKKSGFEGGQPVKASYSEQLDNWIDPMTGSTFTGPRAAIDDMKELLDRNQGFYGNREIRMVSKAFNSLTNMFKKAVTLPFPAFGVRNFYSDFSRTIYQQGVRSFDPMLHRDTFRVMSGFDVSGEARKIDLATMVIPTKEGGFVTGQQVAKEFLKNGMMSFDVQRYDLDKFMRTVLGEKSKWYRVDKMYMNEMTKFNVHIENYNKMLNFIAEIKDGKDFATAAANTKHFLYDYRMLPKAQQVMAKIFPFWRWTYNNMKFITQKMVTSPGQNAFAMRGVTEAPQALRQLLGTKDLTDSEKQALPKFFKDNMMIPLYRTATGAGILAGIDLPIEELNEYGIGLNPIKTMQKLVGTRLNPYIKGALELMSKTDFFYGTPLKGSMTEEGITSYPMERGYPLYDKMGLDWLFGTEKVKTKDGQIRYNVDAWRKKVFDTLVPQATRLMATAGKLSEAIPKIAEKPSLSGILGEALPLATGAKVYERNLLADQMRSMQSTNRQLRDLLQTEGYMSKRRVVE